MVAGWYKPTRIRLQRSEPGGRAKSSCAHRIARTPPRNAEPGHRSGGAAGRYFFLAYFFLAGALRLVGALAAGAAFAPVAFVAVARGVAVFPSEAALAALARGALAAEVAAAGLAAALVRVAGVAAAAVSAGLAAALVREAAGAFAATGAFAAAAAALAVVAFVVTLGSLTVPAMTSLKYLPGRKAGTVVFLTFTAWPVRGFRAVLAARARFSNTPNPEIETLSPRCTSR